MLNPWPQVSRCSYLCRITSLFGGRVTTNKLVERTRTEALDELPQFVNVVCCKQMVNTRRIPLTFAPDEPNMESLEAIREGDAFLSSGKKGRFDNAADLIAAAMA